MIDYRLQSLPNGIRIVTAQMPWWRSLTMGIFSGSGSRHEPARRHGIAHFTEHMLFKGTDRRGPKRIVIDAENVGASLNAYTSEEHTCYHVKSPAGSLGRMADLLVDIYRHSTFPDREIRRERGVIEDEILMYRDQPSSHVEDLLASAVWSGHPLGRPILGTPETLATVGRDDFHDYTRRAHAARNTVVAVASPWPHQAVFDQLAPLLESISPGQRQRMTCYLPKTGQREPPSVILESRAIEQTNLCLGFHTGGRHSSELYASRLLSVLLGETMSSRLTQALRERRGLCYHLCSSRDIFRETGLFSIYAAFDPRHLNKVAETIVRELQKLKAAPPGKRELKRALDYTAGQHAMSLEETSTHVFWLGDAVLNRDSSLDPDDYLSALRNVAAQDIQKVAQGIFQPSNLTIAGLGAGLENHAQALRAIFEKL